MSNAVFSHAPPPPHRVWFGLLGPPTAWAAQGLLGWLVDWLACPAQSSACAASAGKHLWGVELGITLAALAVAVLAFGMNLGPYRQSSEDRLTRTDAHSRPEFLRACALLVSMVFGLGIVFSGLPPLLLDACARVR
jgi:hypothetical protein